MKELETVGDRAGVVQNSVKDSVMMLVDDKLVRRTTPEGHCLLREIGWLHILRGAG
jgi:hypothetical protein